MKTKSLKTVDGCVVHYQYTASIYNGKQWVEIDQYICKPSNGLDRVIKRQDEKTKIKI